MVRKRGKRRTNAKRLKIIAQRQEKVAYILAADEVCVCEGKTRCRFGYVHRGISILHRLTDR